MTPRCYHRHEAMRTDAHPFKCDRILCQNCVRYPLKPRSNTMIYGDTLKQIVVAGSR